MIDVCENTKCKFFGAMLWHALGDALGSNYEFYGLEQTSKLTLEDLERDFYRYTDDTVMMLCIARSIVDKQGFDEKDILIRYIEEYNKSNIRGIGMTTKRALSRYIKEKIFPPGVISFWAAGNGVAMRVTPIALYCYNRREDVLYEYVRRDAYLTHRNELAISGAFAVALGIRYSFYLNDKERIVEESLRTLEKFGIANRVYDRIERAISFVERGDSHIENLEKIGTGGYVVESVACAFYCFYVSKSPLDAILLAIRGGGDTDTNAAMAGALAGAFYGYMEHEYFSKLESYDEIKNLAEQLYLISSGKVI